MIDLMRNLEIFSGKLEVNTILVIYSVFTSSSVLEWKVDPCVWMVNWNLLRASIDLQQDFNWIRNMGYLCLLKIIIITLVLHITSPWSTSKRKILVGFITSIFHCPGCQLWGVIFKNLFGIKLNSARNYSKLTHFLKTVEKVAEIEYKLLLFHRTSNRLLSN